MKKGLIQTGLLFGLMFFMYACGGGSNDMAPDTEKPGGTGTDSSGGLSISWGPRLNTSDLSQLSGAEDVFTPNVAEAVMRAARAVPNGASQSSRTLNGQTVDEISVKVGRDDDENLVHEVTDSSQMYLRVPAPRVGLELALFTNLIPGIEPDLSSYPHEVMGIWAWNGEIGAFWSKSPSIPPVEFDSGSPFGTATYEGDAVGLHTAGGIMTKFLADVEIVSDFGSHKVSGDVDRFRSFTGEMLGSPVLQLGEAGFSTQGDPFNGDTGMNGVQGGGKWGARWSDGKGWTMGGTFGFAADDGSVGILGAFSACSCASIGSGNPDDPVATN